MRQEGSAGSQRSGEWLPPEFDGDLSYDEALQCLLVIAHAEGGLNDTKVTFQRSGETAQPTVATFRGDLTYVRFVEQTEHSPSHHLFRVGTRGYVSLSPSLVEGARLHTFDGADYYTLAFVMGGLTVVFAEATTASSEVNVHLTPL